MLRFIFDCGGASSGINLYAACLHRAAAFWKDATMAKALQLLGFVNLKDIANACIYPIDKPLAYNDVTRDDLGKERIRFDGMSLLHKSIINNRRLVLIGRPTLDIEDGLADCL